MKVIVHYPKSSTGMEELAKLIEKIHAEAAIAHLNSLPIPAKQKNKIIDEIIRGD